MKRAGTAGALLSVRSAAFGQPASGNEPDPEPLGVGKLDVVYAGADGRVVVTDSTSYLDARIGPKDVVIASSYAGATLVAWTLGVGLKALIVHDVGVGKAQAGISGLPLGDKYGVPIAAVAADTATLSNGNSMAQGRISHANSAASKLGVRPGQTAREAAQLLLKAEAGRKIDANSGSDNKLYEMEKTPNGRILAIWTLFFLGENRYPNDVFALATHSARVAAEHAFRWNVKGWIANDAGPGKNNSGISGLAICGEKGMPAAAVGAMSARIGDALSTYNDGIISALNEPARSRGIVIGMTAKEALHRMLV